MTVIPTEMVVCIMVHVMMVSIATPVAAGLDSVEDIARSPKISVAIHHVQMVDVLMTTQH